MDTYGTGMYTVQSIVSRSLLQRVFRIDAKDRILYSVCIFILVVYILQLIP